MTYKSAISKGLGEDSTSAIRLLLGEYDKKSPVDFQDSVVTMYAKARANYDLFRMSGQDQNRVEGDRLKSSLRQFVAGHVDSVSGTGPLQNYLIEIDKLGIDK